LGAESQEQNNKTPHFPNKNLREYYLTCISSLNSWNWTIEFVL